MSDSSPVLPPLDTLACAALSDAGRVRAENQDAADVVRNTSGERLLIVADGMGGHLGGETASRMCLELVERCFREPHGTPEERLRRGLVLANEEIYSHALGNPELRGMGTTAVVLLLSPAGGAWVAWVGDSRAYRLRGGVLEPLTRDHSLMAEWISLGVLTVEAAETHPRRHELTRALGQAPDVAIDVVHVDVRAGDRFLLCSDGLHGYVPERALRAVLADGAPEDCARTLVERANANGGSDNVSVVVAALPSAPAPEIAAAEAITVPIIPELEPAAEPAPEPVAAPAAPAVATPIPVASDSGIFAAAAAELDGLAAFDPPPAPEPAPDLGPPSAPPASGPAGAAAPEPSDSFSFGEISFGDVLAADEPQAEAPPPTPAPASDPEPEPQPPAAPQVPLLDPPRATRAIQIPMMTPVRARRGLDSTSVLAGVGGTLLLAGLVAGVWLYTGSRHAAAPAPLARAPQARAAAPRPTPRPAPQIAPAPAPAIAPAPAPATGATPEVAPPPAPLPPAPPAKPEIAEVERTPHAKRTEPAREPAPLPAPPMVRTQPTTTVVLVPPNAPPAAPDPAAPATAAGFELPPPVERFVDDWLRALSMHDAALLASLGLSGVPDDFAGTFATRDSFRLVAASIDEERSQAGRYFVRVVVSYAFRDANGRFRTQDEQRWILRDAGGALRYEGRWQQ